MMVFLGMLQKHQAVTTVITLRASEIPFERSDSMHLAVAHGKPRKIKFV